MPRVRKGDVVWVEPKLVAEVEFAEWTHDGHLRAPSYQGLREDKAPEDVRREEPLPIQDELRARGEPRRSSSPNLDKPFWPDEGITKGDLLAYYRAVAPVLVPHLKRPAVHDEALPRRRGRASSSSRRTRRRTCPSGSRACAFRSSTRESPRRSGGSTRRS